MRDSLAAAVVVAVLVVPAAGLAQAPATARPTVRTLMTMTGCLSATPTVSGELTFLDGESGNSYRVTGKGIRRHAGQRVEIIGSAGGKRLSIRGGLLPSPNVAAQAGAMDPAQAAIASQPGGGSVGTQAVLPEFHVTRVRRLDGACR